MLPSRFADKILRLGCSISVHLGHSYLFHLQIMTVQLHIDGAKISFDPPFRTLRDIILTLMSEIVTSAQELPRVRY